MQLDSLIEAVEECDEIRSKRRAIMRYILSETGWQEGVAWSIWTARETFDDRASGRLKAYTQNFCAIIDVSNPGFKRLSELVPQADSLSFLTDDVRADCLATAAAVQHVNDAFYLSGLYEAAGNVTHVSRVGRLHYCYVRQYCIRIDGKVYELIAAELPYPAGIRPPMNYAPLWRASLVHDPANSRGSSPLAKQGRERPARQRDDSPISWVEETPEKAIRDLKKKRIPENFSCSTCGVKSTPEARIGPQGPSTLCNRCGIRWAKSREQNRSEVGEKWIDERKEFSG